MQVSEYYGLAKTQTELDFVDVDVVDDVRLFIDPGVISNLESEWADRCRASVQGFFQCVIDAIVANENEAAIRYLMALSEPNETHLGLSRGQSKGSSVGGKLAERFWRSLSSSKAVHTGLVRDLEDTALLIEGIADDRISDITTNLIRPQLIEFTQETCGYHGIELCSEVPSGPIWDLDGARWRSEMTKLPCPMGIPLLLVPKDIVRPALHFNAASLYNSGVISYLVAKEQSAASLGSLVRRQDGSVSKDKVEAAYRDRYASSKSVTKAINSETIIESPEVLYSYKDARAENLPVPMSNDQIARKVGSSTSTYRHLLEEVEAVKPGNEEADLYERRIEAFLSAIFYPELVRPRRQCRIHDGRKRIDISYANEASAGFFRWLSLHRPAANIVVECKNYGSAIGNPELDQLQGRFSMSRGRVGLLVHRGFGDKEKLWKTCLDTAHDGRGFILPLDDDDLLTMAKDKVDAGEPYEHLRSLFERLTRE